MIYTYNTYRMNKWLFLLFLIVIFVCGCGQNEKQSQVGFITEDKEAKANLQGIWVDFETEAPVFKIEKDTIFYPDTTSQPTFFRVSADTLCIGRDITKYPILKLTKNLFLLKNHNGDVLKLVKSMEPDKEKAFKIEKPQLPIVTHDLKKDTVVVYNSVRYHCYIAVNPTTYKVIKYSYNDDGVKVESVYYDNIIHISVFNGTKKLYSRDFNKRMYSRFVPDGFLSQAILSNIEFDSVDSKGFHFNTIICVPDGASCYLLDTRISFDGKMSMELIEY